jgi:hypothetical protein
VFPERRMKFRALYKDVPYALRASEPVLELARWVSMPESTAAAPRRAVL